MCTAGQLARPAAPRGGHTEGWQVPGRHAPGSMEDKPTSRAVRDAERKPGQAGHMRTAGGQLPTGALTDTTSGQCELCPRHPGDGGKELCAHELAGRNQRRQSSLSEITGTAKV